MAPLLDLPAELLREIYQLLPPDAIFALKLTHPHLNKVLPALQQLKSETFTDCARFALERYSALSTAKPTHLRCMACQASVPLNMFNSSQSPACFSVAPVNGGPSPEVVTLPPFCCAWHVGRLTTILDTEPGGRNEWVSDVRRICMHCCCWVKCNCKCESCGYQMVRTYTRYLPINVERGNFRFWRNTAAGESEDPSEEAKGRLFVREKRENYATGKITFVDLPVRYLDQSVQMAKPSLA